MKKKESVYLHSDFNGTSYAIDLLRKSGVSLQKSESGNLKGTYIPLQVALQLAVWPGNEAMPSSCVTMKELAEDMLGNIPIPTHLFTWDKKSGEKVTLSEAVVAVSRRLFREKPLDDLTKAIHSDDTEMASCSFKDMKPEESRVALQFARTAKEVQIERETEVVYEYREQSGHVEDIKASSDEEAIEKARQMLREGDWGQDWSKEGDRETIHVEANLFKKYFAPAKYFSCNTNEDEWQEYDSDLHRINVAIDPEEPPLEGEASEHDWQSPHELVGGLEENPGVQGNGGGVVITEVCANTGWYKITDTWDQSFGPEPVETVEYREPDDASLDWAAMSNPHRITVCIDEDMLHSCPDDISKLEVDLHDKLYQVEYTNIISEGNLADVDIGGVASEVKSANAVDQLEAEINDMLNAIIEKDRESQGPSA